ncbi:MAG: MerP protein [Bacteroidetes bacterium CG23_combo_of_CG06-09_8_20_14_all_32_9]|nr:MAG: MerP protein [Bacteroidetes bacterium CG23_combo_of_CG06-09_8_20_14_all_32_9]
MKKISLILMILTSLIFCSNSFGQTEEVKIKTSAQCGMCKDRIEKTLSYERGIVSSTLDITTKEVTVIYKPKKTNPDKIRIAISKVGYKADDLKADSIAYKNLPACCKIPGDGKKSEHH